MAAAARLRRHALVLGALLVAGFIGWVAYGTITSGSDIPAPQPQALTRLEGGRAGGKRIDGRSWSFDYRTATMTADGQSAELDDVRDGVLYRDGKPSMHMRAQHISANVAGNSFTASGPVSLTELAAGGRRLQTVGARFDGSRNILYLDHRTTIVQRDITVVVDRATMNFTTGDLQLGRMIGTM